MYIETNKPSIFVLGSKMIKFGQLDYINVPYNEGWMHGWMAHFWCHNGHFYKVHCI